MKDPMEFLGEEFLTWLWFQIETNGGEFVSTGFQLVGVTIDDFIAFAPRDDDETEQTLKKGSPSRSAEASAALRNGRRLRRAKLVIAKADEVWSLVLDGPTMGMLNVRLPDDDPDAESADERSRERVRAFVHLNDIVAGLYELFLTERLSPDYSAADQAVWMRGRSSL